MPMPELMMIRKPNSELPMLPVLKTITNKTISKKVDRVNTLARMMSQVVRPLRGGRVFIWPRATRSATSWLVNPETGEAIVNSGQLARIGQSAGRTRPGWTLGPQQTQKPPGSGGF